MDLGSVLIILLTTVAAFFAVQGLERREQRYALLGFAMHVGSSFAHWAIMGAFYGSVNDARGFQDFGIQLARVIESDVGRFAPEVARLALHLDANLPFEVAGAGSSSGTMSAIAGVFIFAAGPSLLSMCLMTTALSWFGQLCIYRVAREALGNEDRTAALIGCFFVPSVIFWGAGFDKEAFVLAFLGVFLFSTYRLLRGARVRYLLGLAVGGIGVAMIKPYTLVAYVVGVSAAVYADRSWQNDQAVRFRPGYLVVAAALSISGLVAIGSVFPDLRADNVADTMAQNRRGWEVMEGGSNIELGSATADASVAQELELLPLSLINTFFRPAIFEARNGTMFVASVETTLVLLAMISVVRARGALLRALVRLPFLAFSAAFVFVFAIGVGLATRNLGSLSRYRIPMMPFLATSLLVLRRQGREAKTSASRDRRAVIVGRLRTSRAPGPVA